MTEYEQKVIQLLTAIMNGQVALMICQPPSAATQAMIARLQREAARLKAEMKAPRRKKQSAGR